MGFLFLLIPLAIGAAIWAIALRWSVEFTTQQAPDFSTCFWLSAGTMVLNVVLGILPLPQLVVAVIVWAIWIFLVKAVFALETRETVIVVAINTAILFVLWGTFFCFALMLAAAQ